MKPRYRGYLLVVDKRHLELLSTNYKYPVVLIPSEEFQILNTDAACLANITSAINDQLVHKFSGVKFRPPEPPEMREVLDKLIQEFDAEVIDVEL